jgi:hypothetical protein
MRAHRSRDKLQYFELANGGIAQLIIGIQNDLANYRHIFIKAGMDDCSTLIVYRVQSSQERNS